MLNPDRCAAVAAALDKSARDAGIWISGDGRIGEGDLAKLLGMNPGSLANLRSQGASPPWYRMGGAGHRISYRLTDVAEWIEGRLELP